MWKLKLDENGNAVLNNGLPVFIDDDENETDFDPNQMRGKILELNGESKKRREENKMLKDSLAAIEDIEDIQAYRALADEAINTVQNLKDKDLVQAGEVDKLKEKMTAGFDEREKKLMEQFATKEQELTDQVQMKDAAIRTLMVSNRFATSPLFSGDDPLTTLPPDIAETYFGKHFSVNSADGKLNLTAVDDNGDVILSNQRIGEPATFDEALEIIFNRYPGKDKLLRSAGGGSGGSGGKEGPTVTTPLAKLKAAQEQAAKDGNWPLQMSLTTQISEVMREQKNK